MMSTVLLVEVSLLLSLLLMSAMYHYKHKH